MGERHDHVRVESLSKSVELSVPTERDEFLVDKLCLVPEAFCVELKEEGGLGHSALRRNRMSRLTDLPFGCGAISCHAQTC